MKEYWKYATFIGVCVALFILGLSYFQYNGIGSVWMPPILTFLSYIVAFFIAIFFYRKKNNGYVTFTDAFLICVIINVAASVFSTPLTMAYASSFSESAKNQILDNMVDKSLYNNYFDERDELALEDQLRRNYENMFNVNASSILSVFWMIFVIAVFGLIIALIMRKDPPLVVD